MISPGDAHVRWYWTITWDEIEPWCAVGNTQSKAGCTPCFTSKYPSVWGVWSGPFLSQKLLYKHIPLNDRSCPAAGKSLAENSAALFKQRHCFYPSRRLFPEDNSKLYDVKNKSSIESWQVFDMFCLSEGNDRSKKTREFSSLLET